MAYEDLKAILEFPARLSDIETGVSLALDGPVDRHQQPLFQDQQAQQRDVIQPAQFQLKQEELSPATEDEVYSFNLDEAFVPWLYSAETPSPTTNELCT